VLDPRDVYEVFVQWPAYMELHDRLGGDPRETDPRDLIGRVAAYGHDRAAATIFAGGVTADLDDAAHVLDELLELAHDGRRPRYGREMHPDFATELVRLTGTQATDGGITP
jgi:hypothetical protein